MSSWSYPPWTLERIPLDTAYFQHCKYFSWVLAILNNVNLSPPPFAPFKHVSETAFKAFYCHNSPFNSSSQSISRNISSVAIVARNQFPPMCVVGETGIKNKVWHKLGIYRACPKCSRWQLAQHYLEPVLTRGFKNGPRGVVTVKPKPAYTYLLPCRSSTSVPQGNVKCAWNVRAGKKEKQKARKDERRQLHSKQREARQQQKIKAEIPTAQP